MGDRVQQRRIDARQPRRHARIGCSPVHQPLYSPPPPRRVGGEDFPPSSRQPPAHPRAVRAGFQGRAGLRIIGREPVEGARSIGNREFLEEVCLLIEDADGVFPVAEVDAEGE